MAWRVKRRHLALGLGLLVAIVGAVGAGILLKPASDVRTAVLAGDYGTASALLGAAADAGNPTAQNALANLYLLGLGVPVDHRKAARLYLQAALNESAAAQVNLGHLYSQVGAWRRTLCGPSPGAIRRGPAAASPQRG